MPGARPGARRSRRACRSRAAWAAAPPRRSRARSRRTRSSGSGCRRGDAARGARSRRRRSWPAGTRTTWRRRCWAARCWCSGIDPPQVVAARRSRRAWRLVLVTPAYARRDRAGARGAAARRCRAPTRSRRPRTWRACWLGLERGDADAHPPHRWSTAIAEPRALPLYPGYPEARAAGLRGGRRRRRRERRGADGAWRSCARARRPRGGRGHGRTRYARLAIDAARPRGARSTRGARACCPRERRRSSARPAARAIPGATRARTCACGGLLEVVHAGGPRGRALRATLRPAPRAATRPVAGSGVWRFRELLLPGPRPDRRAPRGQHARSTGARPVVALRGRRRPGARSTRARTRSGSFKDRGMTVAVTQRACASGATGGRLRVDRQHLGLDGRLRGPCGPAGAGVRARGQGGGRQAGAGAGVRRAHAARARRLRRLPAPGPRGDGGARHHAAQLRQPLADRGTEDDRAGAAAAARLGPAGLDRGAGRQPRQHGRVRQGAARGEGARAHPAACRGSPPSRPRARPRSTGASAAGSRSASACRRRRSRPPSASATPPATTARCARSGRPAAWWRPSATPRSWRPRRSSTRAGHRLRAGLGRVGRGRAPARASAASSSAATAWSPS